MYSSIFPSISGLGPFVYDIPAPSVDGGNSLSQNIAEAKGFTIISLDIFFERHGDSGGSDALLNGLDEALSFRDIFLFVCAFYVMPRAVIYLRSDSK